MSTCGNSLNIESYLLKSPLPATVIEMFEYGLLKDAGRVSAEIARLHAETEFEKYRVIQDREFLSDYDKFLLELEEHADAAKAGPQEEKP